MTTFAEFFPLTDEDINSIRVRMDADANAGVAPTEDGFLDTVEGSFYSDIAQALGLEVERLWDFLGTEVVAAMFITTAWGDYLDMHGEVLTVPRKDEVKATGEVTFTAPAGTAIASGTQVASEGTDPDADPILFATTASGTVGVGGTLTLAIQAVAAGPSGNVQTNAISVLVSPVDGVTAVHNAAPTASGADVEDDDPYRARLLLEMNSTTGGGTIADYERWVLSYPGIGHVTVEPVWSGPTTVRVIVTDALNQPVSGPTLAGLQGFLDPVAGHGEGQAPIGHFVTCATPVNVPVSVVAVVQFLPGYSLDGASGTIAQRGSIEAALKAYWLGLGPGVDVIHNHALAQFFRADGVYNVTGLTLNGSASDIVIAPLEVATLTLPITLT